MRISKHMVAQIKKAFSETLVYIHKKELKLILETLSSKVVSN